MTASIQRNARDLAKAAPADIAQVSLLIDRSGSMSGLEHYVRDSIETVIGEFQKRDGAVLAVRLFNDDLQTVSEFGSLAPAHIDYTTDGGTALYRSVAEAIQKSRDDATLTPELRTHHVIVVITDGHDQTYGDRVAELAEAQRQIDAIDVESTFLMVDFSDNGRAGLKLGLRGVHVQDRTPEAFKDAMNRVRSALGQIADNVVKRLPPARNLCLPPAR